MAAASDGESTSMRDSVAVVTGAATGIGAACARALAVAGASVAVADIDVGGAERVADSLRAEGHAAIAVPLDVRSRASVEESLVMTADTLGHPDILVNDAAWRVNGPALELSEDDWVATLDVTLSGVFRCSRAFAAHAIGSGRGGRIVNVASQLGLVGHPGMAAYTAAKGGVVNLTRSLALEWAPLGISVNAVAPGPTRTEPLVERLEARPGLTLENFAAGTALGRVAEPAEIAAAVVFLASAAASYMTGAVLVVDGGWTAR